MDEMKNGMENGMECMRRMDRKDSHTLDAVASIGT